MDPDLLKYYNRELQYIRAMGGEFSKEFPKIAGRLGLSAFECDDPYVERLLEGFAFLSARVQLKVDAEFPRFTQHMLEMVYPHFLAPLPSMTVVQMEPDFAEGSLNKGVVIPRHEKLRSLIAKGEQTACEYRTAHDVTLWPLKIKEAEYLTSASAVTNLGVSMRPGLTAGLRLRFKTAGGLMFNELALDRLPVYLRGEEIAYQLYEHLTTDLLDVVARPIQRPAPWKKHIPVSNIKGIGFDENQSILPYTARSFQGYRLLQEYFAMPERFLFVEFGGLKKAVSQCEHEELELIFLFKRGNMELSRAVDLSHFELFCTPAVNLFEKRADRIHLSDRTSEFHIVPDRNKPMDFEVYSISEVKGYAADVESKCDFLPFYQIMDEQVQEEKRAYYTIQRELRRLSTKQRNTKARSRYVGSEVFISLVDADEAPYSRELKQIGLKLLCTNRDLPLHMPVGNKRGDFTLQSGEPVSAIRCVAGPTAPRATIARQATAWQLISHLSLNYLSLTDNDKEEGSAALRQILSLYADVSEPNVRKQVEGVRSISTRPVIRRINLPGPMTFGRGIEVTVEFDESAFQGSGVIILGAVLNRFFERYTSINSFTETVIRSVDRGEIVRWPAQVGTRRTL